MVPNVYTSLRLRLRLRLLLSPNTLATTYVSRARWKVGKGGLKMARGKGREVVFPLGQCSRQLSWPVCLVFPAGSNFIYFSARLSVCSVFSVCLYLCLSLCLSVSPSVGLFIRMYFAIAQCDAMRFASQNLCSAQHFIPAWLH